MPGNEDFYDYHRPAPKLMKALEQLSLDAYIAVGGTGYGRLDIRMDKTTGKLYMLEVNAQCGLSEDEDYTSIGAILRYSETTFFRSCPQNHPGCIQQEKFNPLIISNEGLRTSTRLFHHGSRL